MSFSPVVVKKPNKNRITGKVVAEEDKKNGLSNVQGHPK